MPNMWLCGVSHGCTGATLATGGPYLHKASLRGHGSPEEAFQCKVQSLLREGYSRVGPRAFSRSADEPILVIDKRSKFGQRVYYTKEKTRWITHDKCVIL